MKRVMMILKLKVKTINYYDLYINSTIIKTIETIETIETIKTNAINVI
jgi:hypothetical protein